jgi:hypothetical protein
VGQDGAPAAPDAAPVRPSVPKSAAHPKSLPAHCVGLFTNVENASYSTHGIRVYLLSYAFPFSGGGGKQKRPALSNRSPIMLIPLKSPYPTGKTRYSLLFWEFCEFSDASCCLKLADMMKRFVISFFVLTQI